MQIVWLASANVGLMASDVGSVGSIVDNSGEVKAPRQEKGAARERERRADVKPENPKPKTVEIPQHASP